MKTFRNIITSILCATLWFGTLGCSNPETTRTPHPQSKSQVDLKQTRNRQVKLVVHVDENGRAHDEQGIEITARVISDRLQRGEIDRDTEVLVVMNEKQTERVLEVGQIFTERGFKSVSTIIVTKHPDK